MNPIICRPAFVSVCSALLLVSACMPPVEEETVATVSAPEPDKRIPKFRSAKSISSICNVDDWPMTFPGFKEAPGHEQRELPPPFVKVMSIGADRPIVETDNERVAPGYTLIEPFSEQSSFLINNDREIIATLANRHTPMYTEILPNGHRIVESNRHAKKFEAAGGFTGCLEEYDEHGNLVWQLNLTSDDYIAHP